jgi:glutaminyl-tRNA synthetase
VDIALLEHCLREDLNKRARRAMAVLKPLKVVIDNYPPDQSEEMEASNNPEDSNMGTRMVPFSRIIYIEQDDFREDPPKKFYRLAPGREVRLRYAYFIRCISAVKDPQTGEITALHCTYDPASRGGESPDGRKVKATLHWVSAGHAVDAEVRLYENLFTSPDPEDVPEGQDFRIHLNPNSLAILKNCKLEPSLLDARPADRYQFERLGYFCADITESRPGRLIFNRTVSLKDTWARIEKTAKRDGAEE